MKKAGFLLIFIMIGTIFSFMSKGELDNVFYCFNNGVRTLPNAPVGFDAQAEFIKKIGFNGFGGHTSEDYFKRRTSLDKVGLAMPEIYWGMDLTDEGEITYKEEIKDIIKASKDRDLLITLFLNAKKFMTNKAEGDKLYVKGIQELADFAANYNVKVAIYPHVNNYCEESAHSIKLAKMINRDNAGVVFNLCHLFKVEGDEGWEDKAIAALPYLYMVSINGSDMGDTKNMDWDQLIQPLGEGTFDTYQLVKLLKDNGYEGKFGLQCYNIKQDCEVALTKSMNTWRNFQERYSRE